MEAVINYRFANVDFNYPEGQSVWQYAIPGYLQGKLGIGDVVAAVYDGEIIVGRIVSLDYSQSYSNVGTIADKIDVDRWSAYMEALKQKEALLKDLESERQYAEAMASYKEVSGDVAEVAALMAKIAELEEVLSA